MNVKLCFYFNLGLTKVASLQRLQFWINLMPEGKILVCFEGFLKVLGWNFQHGDSNIFLRLYWGSVFIVLPSSHSGVALEKLLDIKFFRKISCETAAGVFAFFHSILYFRVTHARTHTQHACHHCPSQRLTAVYCDCGRFYCVCVCMLDTTAKWKTWSAWIRRICEREREAELDKKLNWLKCLHGSGAVE